MVAVASFGSGVLSLKRSSAVRSVRRTAAVQQRRLVVRAGKTEPIEDVPFSSHNGASNTGSVLMPQSQLYYERNCDTARQTSFIVSCNNN